jgi:DNA-binding beta-propeller fold protein YncE
MKRTSNRYYAGLAAALLVTLAVAQLAVQRAADAQAPGGRAPIFQVDPMWPKPLPNHWVLGSVIGVAVDSQDHIWIIHRPSSLAEYEKGAALEPPIAECCVPAPQVLEFDQAGNLLRHWGGPGAGYEWPQSEHGIFVDYKDNVWIAGSGATDAHVLKFAQSGKFLLQIGRQGMSGGSRDTKNLGRPADVGVDPATNEVFVADGYNNHRVIVFDADSGAFKRMWGAYGQPPDDNPPTPAGNDPRIPGSTTKRPTVQVVKEKGGERQLNYVHCVVLSNDGLVYVCDRLNNRFQVFRKDGTFVKEMVVAPKTLGDGAAWDVAFSKDPQQEFFYNPDGQNMRIMTLRRATGELVRSFGDGGRQPGQFYGPHSVAIDSRGNMYITETYEGKRLQRFLYKGVGPAAR